jgi:hypothetical protein
MIDVHTAAAALAVSAETSVSSVISLSEAFLRSNNFFAIALCLVNQTPTTGVDGRPLAAAAGVAGRAVPRYARRR